MLRYALLLLSLLACEETDSNDTATGPDDTGTSDEQDCVVESVDEPMNEAASGAMAEKTVDGGVCDGGTDEFIVNVSTGCQIQTQVTFAEERVEGALVADGSLTLRWAGSYNEIGTTERVEDGSTVTLTNNPTDDSFGAVRIHVTHTAGEQLDYTLKVSTTCS